MAKGAIQSAWRVEVWSWRRALSHKFLALASESYGACRIVYLDDLEEEQLRVGHKKRHADTDGNGHTKRQMVTTNSSALQMRAPTMPIRLPAKSAVSSTAMKTGEVIDLTSENPSPTSSTAADNKASKKHRKRLLRITKKQQKLQLKKANKKLQAAQVQRKKASVVGPQLLVRRASSPKAMTGNASTTGDRGAAKSKSVIVVDLTEEDSNVLEDKLDFAFKSADADDDMAECLSSYSSDEEEWEDDDQSSSSDGTGQ